MGSVMPAAILRPGAWLRPRPSSFLSTFLSPQNRPMFVVCALRIRLRGRCYNSLSSCCYSLVKRLPSHHHFQGRELRHSPRVHSSCTGTNPVRWTSFVVPSPVTTENTVISEGEDIAPSPAQEITCSHGTDHASHMILPLTVWQRVLCPGPDLVHSSCPSAAFECRYSPAGACITVCKTSPSPDGSCGWD